MAVPFSEPPGAETRVANLYADASKVIGWDLEGVGPPAETTRTVVGLAK